MTDRPVVLVETTRRDVGTGHHLVESRHAGHLVLLAPDGTEHGLGDPGRLTFVRSAAKPFQATACLEIVAEAGGGARPALSDDELAVAWASHRAEADHLAAVGSLLHRSGTAEEDLTCPPATPPQDPAAPARRIQHNCSGKHALFALAGRALDVPQTGLLDPRGPLQERVLGHLEQVFGPAGGVGVDGCGAPAVAAPLRALAAGFQRFLVDDRYRAVRDAGLRHPALVGGDGRLESALLAAGVVAKPGAEAVFAAAWRDDEGAPWAVALKVEDGSSRAAPVALNGLLGALGVTPADLWSPEPILGGGDPQGVVRPAPAISSLAARVGRG